MYKTILTAMAQILDPIPESEKGKLICCYVNATSSIQIARITNVPNWYFERVVFPGQRLLFEAMTGSLLEIHTGMMASAILSDTITCESLAINDGPDEETTPVSKQEKPTVSDSVVPYKTSLISAN